MDHLEERLRRDLRAAPPARHRAQRRGFGTLALAPVLAVVLILIGGSLAYTGSLRGATAATSQRPIPTPLPSASPAGFFGGRTPPPGEALIVGQVVQGSFQPVAGATVRLDPYGLDAITDAQGDFEFDGLAVSGHCRWATLTVTAPGFGRLRTIDNPLYPARAVFQLILEPRDADHYIGAPQGALPPGDAFCSR